MTGKNCLISHILMTGNMPKTMWPNVILKMSVEMSTLKMLSCKWIPSCGEKNTTGTILPKRFDTLFILKKTHLAVLKFSKEIGTFLSFINEIKKICKRRCKHYM